MFYSLPPENVREPCFQRYWNETLWLNGLDTKYMLLQSCLQLYPQFALLVCIPQCSTNGKQIFGISENVICLLNKLSFEETLPYACSCFCLQFINFFLRKLGRTRVNNVNLQNQLQIWFSFFNSTSICFVLSAAFKLPLSTFPFASFCRQVLN